MSINDLLGGMGNIYPFPGSYAYGNSLQAQEAAFQQQVGLAGLQRSWQPVEVPTPEECKQHEITSKNRANYARWLARMMREPLEDVPFR